MHSNTKDAINATPTGSKRDKLERIAALGWGIRRVKRGKHTVIELLEPDSGGTYNVWTVKTEADLDSPGLLVALHWDAHGSDGLVEIKARVWAGNSGTMTAKEAARDWFTLPPHYRHTAALAERFAAFAASQNAAMTAEIARLRERSERLHDDLIVQGTKADRLERELAEARAALRWLRTGWDGLLHIVGSYTVSDQPGYDAHVQAITAAKDPDHA